MEGSCLVTDGEGDKYKLKFSRANSGSGGVQTWEGLTGAYVDVKGNCTCEYRPRTYDGMVHGINPAKCLVTK